MICSDLPRFAECVKEILFHANMAWKSKWSKTWQIDAVKSSKNVVEIADSYYCDFLNSITYKSKIFKLKTPCIGVIPLQSVFIVIVIILQVLLIILCKLEKRCKIQNLLYGRLRRIAFLPSIIAY